MKFRNSNAGILLRRWLSKWMFWPIFLIQYIVIWYKFIKNTNKPLVIVLTMGKVGSSSVYFSIKHQLTKRVFHIHYISKDGIAHSWKSHKYSSRKSVPLHLITSRILEKRLRKYKGEVYFITLFREPIQRKISSFFQNLDQHQDKVGMRGLNFDSDKVYKLLNDNYFLNNLQEEDEWITNELMNTYSFEVYNKEKIETNSYLIERNESKHLLVLKMETLSENFSEAMNAFFKTETNCTLKTYNDGNLKYYSSAYKLFKEKFGLKESTLDKVCDTDYFKTFYHNLRPSLLKKWKK